MEAVAAAAASTEEAHATPSVGDLTAFKELYQPQFEGVHDYALRAVRDRSLAADVVRRTFTKAWEAFPDRRIDIYAVARDYAREALRYRERRNGDEREALDFTRVDFERLSHRSDVTFDRELVELVWDDAAALSLEEYSLLALGVRHGVGPENGNGMRAARLREAFDDRVTSELVRRRGRQACAELDALLSADDDLLTHHIGSCDRCRARKRNFVPPTDVLRALAPMRPSSKLEADVWNELEAATGGRRRRRFGIL